MSSTYLTIIQEIANLLATVPNVGAVHQWQRYLKAKEEQQEAFVDPAQEKICTWTIARESFTDEQSCTQTNTQRSLYVLRGYMSVNDSEHSEHLFQVLIDEIIDKFRPQTTLNDNVETTEPLQARLIGYGEYCGVFCHVAELTMIVQENFRR
jgi:hypothetical protein